VAVPLRNLSHLDSHVAGAASFDRPSLRSDGPGRRPLVFGAWLLPGLVLAMFTLVMSYLATNNSFVPDLFHPLAHRAHLLGRDGLHRFP